MSDPKQPPPADQAKKGPSQASALVSLATAAFDVVVSEDGRPYGVRRDGPNIALPLRGKAGLRSQLAHRFTAANGGQVPSQAALADAMTVLEGMAASNDPVPVHLRVAGDYRRVVLDLGTADGRCVVVTPGHWQVQARSPVLFRRSGAMSPMPEPARASDGLAQLRGLLNMDDRAFRQLVAWLVAAWIPHIPHPVLTFKGEQGTGKSKTAEMVVNLIDPSPATKRAQPRDVKTWATQAFNSWALCLDNVSTIAPWLSDTLCRAVTGDGIVDRALYTDDDVVVLVFRRVLAMTTIDAGALAGDLAERLLMLDLQLIEEARRRTEEELDTVFNAARPAVLGSLLDLLAAVMETLPAVRLDHMPRLADFARVLAAVDQVNGWTTLADYNAAAQNVAADALEGDPFGSAVAAFIETHGAWTGTAGQLLELIPPPDGYHPKWPKDAPRAGGQLKRLAPLLRSVGISYDDTGRSADRQRQRLISLATMGAGKETSRKILSAPHLLSATPSDLGKRADSTTESTVRKTPLYCPHPDGADSKTRAADSTPDLLSANGTASDLREHPGADSRASADSNSQQLSTWHLLCAACSQPMNPALTAAGHLAHPDCQA